MKNQKAPIELAQVRTDDLVNKGEASPQATYGRLVSSLDGTIEVCADSHGVGRLE